MAIAPTVANSLRVDVNRSPIAYITIPSSLECLEVTLDIEFSQTSEFREVRERVASIVRPPKPEIGILCMSKNKVEVSACRDVKAELHKCRKKFPDDSGRWYYDDLVEQDLEHTVQMPVQALHQAGFITADQVEKISSFVRSNRLQNMA